MFICPPRPTLPQLPCPAQCPRLLHWLVFWPDFPGDPSSLRLTQPFHRQPCRTACPFLAFPSGASASNLVGLAQVVFPCVSHLAGKTYLRECGEGLWKWPSPLPGVRASHTALSEAGGCHEPKEMIKRQGQGVVLASCVPVRRADGQLFPMGLLQAPLPRPWLAARVLC